MSSAPTKTTCKVFKEGRLDMIWSLSFTGNLSLKHLRRKDERQSPSLGVFKKNTDGLTGDKCKVQSLQK